MEGESYEEIISRHRKEKRDLQGKIQALKKTATKGDKKKRKEVCDEISKLENELDKKQNDELANYNSTNNTNMVNNTVESVNNLALSDGDDEDNNLDEVPGLKQQRITKAKRRRDKKALMEKERDLRITQQESENVYGSRAVELETIKNILKERNLMIQEIPSDGNCLYCAIDHQLKQCQGNGPGIKELRLKTSTVLRENSNEYLPFLSHPDTGEMLTENQFYDYCDQVAQTTAWGGQVELRALSEAMKCCVEVIQAEGPPMIVGEAFLKEGGPKLVLTYHRRMYSLGEHYNSVKPYVPEEEEAVE